jgi:hypothetical protein
MKIKKKVMVMIIFLFLVGCNPVAIDEQDDFENLEKIDTENIVDKVIVEENVVEELIEKPVQRCNDGTIYSECSSQKPYYCLNGNIIKKASVCGCPENQIASNENCVSAFEITSKENTFEYTLRGKQNAITMIVHKELNDFLSLKPQTYVCDPECPSARELELKYINNPEQKQYLKKLVTKIQEQNIKKSEQARIAISLVQSIPYADSERRKDALTGRYPYEVLHDDLGVCGEKSALLAFILRELGYGVSLFHYPKEKHMTVGIKCPIEYSYKESGYCFIETVEPIIATYIPSEYVDIGSLSSDPEIVQISDGDIFEIKEEYDDARELERINKLGVVLEPLDYAIWRDLMKKYGIYVRGRLFFK